jgi:hypothetical protein
VRSSRAVGSAGGRFGGGLSETGYVEARNVLIEHLWANNDLNRLPELAADLVRRNVARFGALPDFLHTVRTNSCPMQRDRTALRIEAPATCPEGGKLQEPARDGDILQEMDHLVLIAEVAVSDHCGGDAPQRQNNPGEARLIADNEQYAADAFDQDRNDRGNERKRKAFRAHERHRAAEFGELLEPAQHEDYGEQEPSEESGCIVRW